MSTPYDVSTVKEPEIIVDGSSNNNNEQLDLLNSAVRKQIDRLVQDQLKEAINLDDRIVGRSIYGERKEKVPFDSSTLYELLLDADGVPLYDKNTRKWRDYPLTENLADDSDESMSAFFEKVKDAVLRVLKKSDLTTLQRGWSEKGDTYNRPPDTVPFIEDSSIESRSDADLTFEDLNSKVPSQFIGGK